MTHIPGHNSDTPTRQDKQQQWARTNLSADGYARWLAAQSSSTAGPNTQGPNGMYYYSDRTYGPVPEPVVPIRIPQQYVPSFGTYRPGDRGRGPANPYTTVPAYGYLDGGAGWNRFTPSELRLLDQAAFAFAGYDISKSRPSLYPQVFQMAVSQSQTLRSMGINRDPMEILGDIAAGMYFGDPGDGSSGGGGGYGGGGGGGGTTTVTTTNITNADTAKRLINQAMGSYLGREATKEERRKFLEALNEGERENPTIQTITADASSQSQMVEGGFDAAQFSEEFSQSRPDYAEYRAATDLMDAFLGILQGPVR